MSNQSAGTSFHMENFKRRSRYAMVFILLILAFGLITVLNINTGNVHISLSEIIDILLKKATDTKEYSIIWKIRLPRILMAAILGGALSLSGFLLQTFFENPIAGPFVLGISSGAKMVVALTMIYYLGRAVNVTSYTLIIAAFIGSLISIGFILLISKRRKLKLNPASRRKRTRLTWLAFLRASVQRKQRFLKTPMLLSCVRQKKSLRPQSLMRLTARLRMPQARQTQPKAMQSLTRTRN